jgi:hypothetical protein
MEKRKLRNKRKEAGRQQKRGYKRAKCNIQTQSWVYESHPRPQDGRGQQSTMLLLQSYLSVDHILWKFKETEDQRMNMDMRKEQWINGKKVWKR